MWRPLRFGMNNLWLALQRLESTDYETRNRLLRMAGVRVGEGARIEPGVFFDSFFPERISVGDGAVIRQRSVLLAHEGLVGRLRIGDVRIGKRAVLEPGTCLVPGTVVGDGARLHPYSFVTRSVPKGAVMDRDGIRAAPRKSPRNR
jgi:maltose O-acetyltransferase